LTGGSTRSRSLYSDFVGRRVRIASRSGVVVGELFLVSDYELAVHGAPGTVVLMKGSVWSVELSGSTECSGQIVPGEILSRLVGEKVSIVFGGNVGISGTVRTVSRYEIEIKSGDRVVLVPKGSIDRIVIAGEGDIFGGRTK